MVNKGFIKSEPFFFGLYLKKEMMIDIVFFRHKTSGILTFELEEKDKDEYEKILFKNLKIISDNKKEEIKSFEFLTEYFKLF